MEYQGYSTTISSAIMIECLKNPPVVESHQKVVEIDEIEVGKRRKEVN